MPSALKNTKKFKTKLAASHSNLPENCDQSVIDDFIEQLYLKEVLENYNHVI